MELSVRDLKTTDYVSVWDAMKEFTDSRDSTTTDELWITEHRAVFTMGQAAKSMHILNPKEIPVVYTDRGGQVTYHGPGQIVAYLLRDLRRVKETVHTFVSNLEAVMIHTLREYGINASRLEGNPGVYVENKKIGALGLRIRHGRSYHGICLNVDMDLSPYQQINPCGLAGMAVTQIADYVKNTSLEEAVSKLVSAYQTVFSYDNVAVHNRAMKDFA
ncbi:MAG: lipoyl(octanoyl) transferase LipB [Gammaproteobacteria bacterium]|nr:lipoyl(octanoyl) transferase LipB [Gammaproteobacteria bacterium]